MSEYWKSTPKYWCKHCKTFVRDTKFEKQNHEATGRHQGNLQRFLRGLHRGHEKEERDKQRAKDEVDRLNGLSKGSIPVDNQHLERKPAAPTLRDGSRRNDPTDRKRQLAQLAEMGVAVPEDFRREMAMAGDWQTVSVAPAPKRQIKEEEGGGPSSSTATGVRKRKADMDEDVMSKSWASAKRSYPGANGEIDDDLDMLLNSNKVHVSKLENLETPSEADAGTSENKKDQIKQEELDEGRTESKQNPTLIGNQDTTAPSGFFFKKRKAKSGKPLDQ